jgi:hypothetical protein
MEEQDLPEEVGFDAFGRDWHSSQPIPFKVWTNHGNVVPHYYVCMDVGEGDEYSWWFDPEQAQALGVRLQQLGRRTHQQNIKEEERQRRLPEGGWVDGPADS